MSRNVLRDKLLALALRDDFPATFVRRERERERRFWANVDHTAFQAILTNLIPYFAFKRLIFYSNIFKNKLLRDCNLNDSHKPAVASTFYSVTQRQMRAWFFVSIFVYIVYFERLRTT